MYTYQAKDGTIITDIPDEISKDDPRLFDMYKRMKSVGQSSAPFGPLKLTAQQESAMDPEAAMLPGTAIQPIPEKPKPGIGSEMLQGLKQGTAATVRGLAGGAANTVGTVIDPATFTINAILDAVGAPKEIRGATLGQATKNLLDMIGVPESETMAAKIVESASRGLGGAATGIGVGGAIAGQAPALGQSMAGAVGKGLASGPLQQAMGGMGSEVASQVAGDMGAGAGVQMAAGLAGGVAGSTLGNVANLRPGAVNQMQGVVDDSARFKTELMTSDVNPPRTFAGKTGQALAEKIPVVGTGPIRAKQQANRIQDVKDLLRQFGADDAAKASDDVMDDLISKKNLNTERWSGMKNKVIDDLSFKNIADDVPTPTPTRSETWDDGTKVDFVKSPFPMIDKKVELPGTNKISQAIETDIDLSTLKSSQSEVTTVGMKKASEQNDKLPLVIRSNGVNYIQDGHHRLAKKAFDGEGSARVRFVNLDSPGKPPDDLSRIVPMPQANKKIDDSITFLKGLKNPSLWDPYIKELEGFKGSIDGQDLRNVEIGRATIGDVFGASDNDSVKRMGKKLVTGTKDSPGIYDAVNEDMGNYIKKAGSQKDFDKWKIANTELSKMMKDLDLDILKNTLEKGVDRPEVVKNMLFSKDRSVIEALNKNLTAKGREAAKTAIMQEVAKKIGEDASPEKFLTEMRKLRSSGDPVGVFFTGDDLKVVEGLTRVLKATSRASQAALNPPTGVQAVIPLSLIGMGGGSVALEKYFGQGLTGLLGSAALVGTAGGAARLYESPTVRNILMKLPAVKPGAKEETALFNRLFEVIKAKETK